MTLNEKYSFQDVRYLISSKVGERMPVRKPDGTRLMNQKPDMRQISYDVDLSFVDDPPPKVLLQAGTSLVRLDFPVTFALFMNVWWMRSTVLDMLLHSTNADTRMLRQEWQQIAAMPKPKKGIRTRVVEIVLTEPVFAWVGVASPLFNRRGGAEQIFLPNLAHGAGPERSNYARLLHTYTVPAI